MALRALKHRQAIDGLGIIGDHGCEQVAEVAEIALDGRPLEQRGGVLQSADDACRPLRCSERVRSNLATRFGEDRRDA